MPKMANPTSAVSCADASNLFAPSAVMSCDLKSSTACWTDCSTWPQFAPASAYREKDILVS